MSWRGFVNEYFTFTRKERIGLLAIVIIIIGISILPKVRTMIRSEAPFADTSWMAAAEKLRHQEKSNVIKSEDENINDVVYDKSIGYTKSKSKAELFYFDPNTLSFESWKTLGVREKTITTIQKYLNKGGHFYKPEDLKKIYGIHTDEYERLEPYIKIEMASNKEVLPDFRTNNSKKEQSLSKNRYGTININIADTSAFIALPGIGSKLAVRIVNFRDKLGGFYSVDQIGETYGLPDSTFQKIKPYLKMDDTSVKTININTATKDEMKSHPYIKWNLANAIVEYRNQHGNYASLDDLKKISILTEVEWKKLKPYLVAE